MPSPSAARSKASTANRVRSFSVTSKGLTRCQEIVRSASATSMSSSESSSGDRTSVSRYRIAMLGSQGVGKTSLTQQFQDCDGMDERTDGFVNEQELSILLDGEESQLVFLDFPSLERSPEDLIKEYDVDGYIVVYSITDRCSYRRAEKLLSLLYIGDFINDKAVILVGNKTDLVRSRVVSSEEGKEMATSFGCKFTETSDWVNHNMDDLLVGVLNQIRLKHQRQRRQQSKRRYKGSKTSLFRSKSLVRDIFRKINSKCKSCDNLHVL